MSASEELIRLAQAGDKKAAEQLAAKEALSLMGYGTA